MQLEAISSILSKFRNSMGLDSDHGERVLERTVLNDSGACANPDIALDRCAEAAPKSPVDLVDEAPCAVFRYVRPAVGGDRIETPSAGFAAICCPVAEALESADALWADYSPETRDEIEATIASAALAGTGWEGVWRRGDAERWISFAANPVSADESGTVWSVVACNVTGRWGAAVAETDRRLAETESRSKERTAQIAAGVAHDFNNLFAAVMGHSELARTAAPEDAQHHVDQAIDAARRGGELSTRLLTFAGKAPVAPSLLDLNDLVRRTAGETLQARPANIEFSCDLSGDLWRVKCDQKATRTAIEQLLNNACDAMQDGGRLTVRTENYLNRSGPDGRAALGQGDRFVMVTVADTGHGVDPSVSDKIFEPFYSSRPPRPGRGMGLAAVHGFAKQAGGLVELDHQAAKGAEFRLFLPASFRDAGASRSSLPHAGRRVLIVETDEALAKSLDRMLAYDRLDVLTATNCDDAWSRIVAGARPELVVSSFATPGRLQGPDLKELCASRRQAIPVILLSRYKQGGSLAGEVQLKAGRKAQIREAVLAALAEAR